MAFPYNIILFLYFFQGPGVGGAKFTLVNSCSQIIWPAILGQTSPETQGFELPPTSSVAVQVPSTRWSGSVWGRTGCTFNASGYGSCATGDCGRLVCSTNPTAITIVEFTLGGTNNLDFYDVSLVNGFNLPLLIRPSEPAQCPSTGCAEDISQICPSQLRTQDGRACLGACEAFNTSEECGPTNYSRVFKEACPDAFAYPQDDAARTFTCSTGANYFITFCPTSLAQTGNGMSPAQPPAPAYSPPTTTNGKNHSKVIIIAVALSIACVIVIVSIILLCFLKRRHSASVPSKESKQHIENFLLQYGSVAPKRYKYSEIKKITKSFSDKLGKGGYGSVFKGVLPDGSLVAVKVLMETDSNGEEFMNEVASISRTSHVNVVTLLGFCYEGEKRALVYEFMPKKSLDKFLIDDGSAGNADCTLDLERLYKIAVGIAKGLEYLHTGCNTRIVHFDIKPQNILLDEDFCPKIADFGLAKLCKKKQSVLSVIGTRGTIGYIAPEIFSRNFGGASHKSDVYSYGMLVLEMAGGKKLVETEVDQSTEDYFPDNIYEQVMLGVTKNLDDSSRDEEEDTRRRMLLVGFWCIQTNPSDRPSISKVVEMLEGSVESIQIPPKPFLFAPKLPDHVDSSPFSAHVDNEIVSQDYR